MSAALAALLLLAHLLDRPAAPAPGLRALLLPVAPGAAAAGAGPPALEAAAGTQALRAWAEAAWR